MTATTPPLYRILSVRCPVHGDIPDPEVRRPDGSRKRVVWAYQEFLRSPRYHDRPNCGEQVLFEVRLAADGEEQPR